MDNLLELFMSGGLVSAIIALFSIRSKLKKVSAEARRLDLENSEKATDLLLENIIEPLKKELYETRTEITLLRQAIHAANNCQFVTTCPVIAQLQEPGARCPAISQGIHDDSSGEGRKG